MTIGDMDGGKKEAEAINVVFDGFSMS